MRILLSLLAGCCLSATACAQTYTGDSLYFILPRDTIALYTDPASDHELFDHHLAPGQTLYGATKFYGLTLDEVYHLNPSLRAGYEEGAVLRVPIPNAVLQPYRSRDSLAWFAPVTYRMPRGETLFGLTHRVFDHLDDRAVAALNPGLTPATLKSGQQIKVGYLKITGIPDSLQGEVEDPYVIRNRGLRELWEARTRGKRLRTRSGKAAWTSKGDRNKWMVLHRSAPINSLIELDDPRSKKVLYARVVGRIPEQMDSDVIVVVSPLLARAFGVRDRRFYLRTRYF